MIRTVRLTAVAVALLASAAFAQTPAPAPAPDKSRAVQTGSNVSIEYTLTDEGGQVLDTNKGKSPLVFTQGQQQIIPGLEREMIGLHAGDQKKVVVKPEDGYGPVMPNAQTEVPKDAIPKEGLKVGTALLARSGSGETRPVVVKEIKDTTVVLDLNHPLAGKTLFFDVKVLGVEPPKAVPGK
ncbi:MAG TPA: peptidylprolyl isomerase [Methylomirabilota bacterium]|nr:peptidylprolyl isomerase [Methylomirabilota bacterium]